MLLKEAEISRMASLAVIEDEDRAFSEAQINNKVKNNFHNTCQSS